MTATNQPQQLTYGQLIALSKLKNEKNVLFVDARDKNRVCATYATKSGRFACRCYNIDGELIETAYFAAYDEVRNILSQPICTRKHDSSNGTE